MKRKTLSLRLKLDILLEFLLSVRIWLFSSADLVGYMIKPLIYMGCRTAENELKFHLRAQKLEKRSWEPKQGES